MFKRTALDFIRKMIFDCELCHGAELLLPYNFPLERRHLHRYTLYVIKCHSSV